MTEAVNGAPLSLPQSLPRYSHNERILLAPAPSLVETKGDVLVDSSQSQHAVNVHVRLETHSVLTRERMSGHTRPAVPVSIASPFSDETVDLLQKYGALSVTIQVRNIASQSFPFPLEHSNILPLGFDKDDLNLNEDDVFGLPLTGPSGVSVRVRFLDVEDLEGTDTDMERDLGQSFLDLLRELVARRFILAPLATIDKRRLHRHVHSTRVKVKASTVQAFLT
jgi:hypothetical protein